MTNQCRSINDCASDGGNFCYSKYPEKRHPPTRCELAEGHTGCHESKLCTAFAEGRIWNDHSDYVTRLELIGVVLDA